jgi:tetratricopeptide (TPR) repeat protein
MVSLWERFDDYAESDFIAEVDQLAGERPPADPTALFERASARDACDQTAAAISLYRQALNGGLDESRRRPAIIQLASSLRAAGDPHEAIGLLRAELGHQTDDLDGAIRAFLALALVDAGELRRAVAESLSALAETLPRYRRSVLEYAQELVPPAEPAQRP